MSQVYLEHAVPEFLVWHVSFNIQYLTGISSLWMDFPNRISWEFSQNYSWIYHAEMTNCLSVSDKYLLKINKINKAFKINKALMKIRLSFKT